MYSNSDRDFDFDICILIICLILKKINISVLISKQFFSLLKNYIFARTITIYLMYVFNFKVNDDFRNNLNVLILLLNKKIIFFMLK